MNILVLANAFEAPNYNARLRAQCDQLVKMGHTMEVYTEPWDELEFAHEYAINEIGDIHSNYLKWLFVSIYSVFTNYKERRFARKVMWQTRKSHYDLVYCSTNSCFPLGAANIVARRKKLPLHVDISEMVELVPQEQDPHPWLHPSKMWQDKLYQSRRNKAIRRANSVTTATSEHVRLLKKINANTTLLFNGFDPDSYYFEEQKADTFRINYIGSTRRSQNTELILKVMNELKTELPDLQWTFYSNHVIYNSLNHMRPNVKGVLPTEVIGDTIRQTSILLMVNDTKANGIQSEQLYRAIGCEKPVLFTPIKEGLLPELIQYSNAGICTNNTTDAKQFIRECYAQWKELGYTHREVMHKEQFDAHWQAELLIKLFEQIIRK